jgi:hypothetical protein
VFGAAWLRPISLDFRLLFCALLLRSARSARCSRSGFCWTRARWRANSASRFGLVCFAAFSLSRSEQRAVCSCVILRRVCERCRFPPTCPLRLRGVSPADMPAAQLSCQSALI